MDRRCEVLAPSSPVVVLDERLPVSRCYHRAEQIAHRGQRRDDMSLGYDIVVINDGRAEIGMSERQVPARLGNLFDGRSRDSGIFVDVPGRSVRRHGEQGQDDRRDDVGTTRRRAVVEVELSSWEGRIGPFFVVGIEPADSIRLGRRDGGRARCKIERDDVVVVRRKCHRRGGKVGGCPCQAALGRVEAGLRQRVRDR